MTNNKTESKEQKCFEKPCDHMKSCDERIKYLEELVRKYKYDYLTGLMGKQDFNEKLNTLFEEYKFADEEFYFILIDINDLHNINRQHGYYSGDQVIKQTAEKLKEAFRFHQIYRISGDEFAILIRTYNTTLDLIEKQLKPLTHITYVIKQPMDYTNPKHLFKAADYELTQKKEISKRL